MLRDEHTGQSAVLAERILLDQEMAGLAQVLMLDRADLWSQKKSATYTRSTQEYLSCPRRQLSMVYGGVVIRLQNTLIGMAEVRSVECLIGGGGE